MYRNSQRFLCNKNIHLIQWFLSEFHQTDLQLFRTKSQSILCLRFLFYLAKLFILKKFTLPLKTRDNDHQDDAIIAHVLKQIVLETATYLIRHLK